MYNLRTRFNNKHINLNLIHPIINSVNFKFNFKDILEILWKTALKPPGEGGGGPIERVLENIWQTQVLTSDFIILVPGLKLLICF